jgi:hypothetical protein
MIMDKCNDIRYLDKQLHSSCNNNVNVCVNLPYMPYKPLTIDKQGIRQGGGDIGSGSMLLRLCAGKRHGGRFNVGILFPLGSRGVDCTHSTGIGSVSTVGNWHL